MCSSDLMNLLTMEWASRGINLWTVEQGEIPLVTGQVAYPLPVDTIDLLDHVVRQYQGTQNQQDISITRISETTYLQIPNKLAQSRPIQLWVNRQSGQENLTTAQLTSAIGPSDTNIQLTSTAGLPASGFVRIDSETIFYTSVADNQLQLCARGQNGTTAASHLTTALIYNQNLPSVSVWPTANSGGDYTLVYYRLRRIQDAGTGSRVQDIPFRLLPAIVAGLSYHLAVKNPDKANLQFLKDAYDEAWLIASTEDREKASLRLAPRQLFW